MSDMKCPFCQQELSEFAGTVDCVNIDCIKTRGWYGNKKLWQELITTRKALDLAITELKNVVEDDDFDIYMRQLSAQTTLEQINEIKGGK